MTGLPYGKIIQIAGPCFSSKEEEAAELIQKNILDTTHPLDFDYYCKNDLATTLICFGLDPRGLECWKHTYAATQPNWYKMPRDFEKVRHMHVMPYLKSGWNHIISEVETDGTTKTYVNGQEVTPVDNEDLLAYFDAMGGATNTCIKCKKNFPYAVPAVKFSCWACNNGY
jgi:hypothetical protein